MGRMGEPFLPVLPILPVLPELLTSKFDHSMRDVQPDDLRAACGGGKRDIACAGREVENTAARANGSELDETPLPSAILSVRQCHRDEVVAVRDRGEERAHIRALSFGGGDAIVNSHQSAVVSQWSSVISLRKTTIVWALMLPSSTVENYLKAIYLGQSALADNERLVSMGHVATALGVTPGTATTMVKALSDSGLAEYEPYSGVRLTAAGERLAGLVIRRHRLVEAFLVQVMGMSWAEVHEEAEQLEHAVSDRLIERIDSMLGHPAHDPHGDPIPNTDGVITPQHLDSLLTCPIGTPLKVTRIADQDPAFLRFIEENDLKPGQPVQVDTRDTAADSVLLRSGERRLTIGARAASKLLVEVA